MIDRGRIRVLAFDVFGTVVDWRTTVIREGRALGKAKGLDVDWPRFADAWRARYQPMLERVRSEAMPWTRLDDLHRMSLDAVVREFGIAGLSPDELEHLNRVWHRLDPWPDAVPGLVRLRRRFVLTALSNGNVSLLVDMARHAELPWDAVLGAEVARQYKPRPEPYLETARLLDAAPDQIMMVAAHNYDLAAAAALGFATAFVARRHEHGPGQTTNLAPERDWDIVAENFVDLADQLDC